MIEDKIKRQFGLWESPVSAVSISRGVSFGDVQWDKSGILVWLENRSDRGVVAVKTGSDDAFRELNSDYSIRAEVGYGGGDFCVGNGIVFFVDSESGRLFAQHLEAGPAQSITPSFGKTASPAISPDGRWLVFVHSYEGQDSIGVVDAQGLYWPQKLVSGDDFYMQPTWSPDGSMLSWISWNHPNMPWDGTFLRYGDFVPREGGLPVIKNVKTIAGDRNTSIFQPQFSPDGQFLSFVSDESGWWHIYLYDIKSGEIQQITAGDAEHGAPAWIQGLRTYGFSPDGKKIFYIKNEAGFFSLWQYELELNKSKKIPLNTQYSFMSQISVGEAGIAMIASGGKTPDRVIVVIPAIDNGEAPVQVIRRGMSEELPVQDYSKPEPVSWKGMDEGNAFGLYYPPLNKRYEGTGKPPLIVYIHGGPTGQSSSAFNPRAQFFTSRGYAFLEVNYRGSAGFGREYRNKLRKNWGIYDVEDAVSGAQYLIDENLVDKERLVILGGSAGGFTVLKTLEDFPGFYKAGICLYGVSNQFTLAEETHKFEAFYSVSLLGPLPEASEIYRERSPVFFVDKIEDPIAVFQGEDDVVVPRSQSDEIVSSLEKRGIPHIYHVYPGEGHGFRKSKTIAHFYNEVDKFLRQNVIFT
ncbi:MAG: S9 family peptidase [Anaerolineales bacterium]|jgi:dipeptidyl aminopeptidase/acylaminoacyl peptidase